MALLGLAALSWSVATAPGPRPLHARPAGTVAAAGGAATITTGAPGPSSTTTSTTTSGTAAPAWQPPPTVPAPVPGTGSVGATSCPSATFCMAVGSVEGGPGGTNALLDAWDGTTWSVLPSPVVNGGTWNSLSSVSCPSATFCMAVGSLQGQSEGTGALFEAWEGTAWSVLPSPDVNGGTWNSLNGVSCPSPTFCVAVGSAQAGIGALVESWDGRGWSVVPSPPVGTSVLRAVACTSASFCAAVGDTEGGPGGTEAVTEVFDGTRWTAPAAPAVGGGAGGVWNSLSAVTCTSASSCQATGTYQPSGTLVEHWDGTTWSVVVPAG